LPLPIKGKDGLLGVQARTACLLAEQASKEPCLCPEGARSNRLYRIKKSPSILAQKGAGLLALQAKLK